VPGALASAPDGQGLVALEYSKVWLGKGGRATGYRQNPRELRGRNGAALATDTDRHVVVLFGGYGQDGLTADTWEWDGRAWSRRAAPAPTDLTIPPAGATSQACALVISRVSETRLGSAAVGISVQVNNAGDGCGPALSVYLWARDEAPPIVVDTELPVRSGTYALVWRNWCRGGPISIEENWAIGGADQALDMVPPCTDRSKPSTLELAR
jgi:hypothetical protein